MEFKMVDNYLAHFGIKGQKWGVRRFQNEDRTLTEAGKERYSRKNIEKSVHNRVQADWNREYHKENTLYILNRNAKLQRKVAKRDKQSLRYSKAELNRELTDREQRKQYRIERSKARLEKKIAKNSKKLAAEKKAERECEKIIKNETLFLEEASTALGKEYVARLCSKVMYTGDCL